MLTILHVDDEPDIREVAALSLELDSRIQVRSAASGAEALEILQADWRPDVVLLDVMMPVMDGPGTLERMRTLPGMEQTPVIFMTARAQANEHGRFLELGAIGVIVKPFDPMTLSQQVRDYLAQAGA